MTITYNAPPGSASDIGPQAVLQKYEKQALITARRVQYLHEMAPSAKSIPRNMGKTIVQDLYVPILDDRNTYAEGLAADGTTVIAGNLYGSSKDIATITAKLPLVNENSNRPNKVGLTRLQRTATITRLGMFLEWSDEAEQFDSDSALVSHFSDELVNAACKISEDLLMMQLLAGAQTIRYAGTATSRATITGEGGAAASLVKFKDLQALSIMLDNAQCPKGFKMYTGTNLVDTKTIGMGRPMFIGTELQPTVENMLDSNSQPAFIPVHKYAAGGAILNGEIGTAYHFRVVVHPDMQHWSDGAALTTNNVSNGYLYLEAGASDKYQVYPMLAVGDDAFATVGFQTTQNGTKFQIIINKPGAGMATLDNPYGNKGFSSIQWWYATLIQRPERLGLILTVAPVL